MICCSINSINFMNNLTWNAKISIITQMFKNCRQVKLFFKNNGELKDGPTFDYPQKNYNFNKLKVDHN